MVASGDVDLISSMAASALEGVLAAKKICSGLCFARCFIDSFPSPVLPERNHLVLFHVVNVEMWLAPSD